MGSKQTGTSTSTSNSSPWAPQQPYLQDIFSRAQGLYNNNTPQYYPGQTYAAPTANQNAALDLTAQTAFSNPISADASNANQSILDGYYMNANPALNYFNNLASLPNQGTSNPTAGALAYQATQGIFNPAAAGLQAFGSSNPGITGNPATGLLESFAANNPALSAPGTGILGGLASNDIAGNNPASSAFASYANGSHVAAGNPYTSALTSNILAQVLPGIQNQFISSGTLSSPEAARASAEGAAAGLAPSLFSNYQNEEANQLGAAGQQSNAYLQGTGLRSSIANQLAQLSLAGSGLQQSAATALGNQALTGAGLQEHALGDLGSQALTGAGLQQNAASIFGNQAIQGLNAQTQVGSALQNSYGTGVQQMLTALGLAPTTQSMPYTDLGQLYSAGATQQGLNQNAINDAVQRWNYGQTSPYQALNQYIGQVTGNYGGSTVASQPILGNPTQDALSGLGSVGKGISSLASILPFLPSDRRLKEDILPLGSARNGLPVYAFKYKGEPGIHVGFMADEVEQVRPAAVVTGPDGFKLVNYELAAA